ncbi:MAG: hypothetical protein HC890_06770 [Chloroflexaceae bacterium]|nr:hypothetical protein [Chloroflexaceae bacterium]
MKESTAQLTTLLLDQAIDRFLGQLSALEQMALGSSVPPRAELRQVDCQEMLKTRPVLVFQCDSIAHRAALLCLKSRLSQAALAIAIPGICLTVPGEDDIGFLCGE